MAVACLASGCATVVPPTAVKLSAALATKALPDIVDRRPAEAKVYREDNSSTSISKYLGDDVLQPEFRELLRHEIADALPPGLASARIELRQADIGFYIPMGSGSGPARLPYMPPNIGVLPAIVGALIGAGIVYGIQRASAKEYAVAYIVLTIDDQSVPASHQVAVTSEVGASDALKEAVKLALATLRERVAAFDATPEAEPGK